MIKKIGVFLCPTVYIRRRHVWWCPFADKHVGGWRQKHITSNWQRHHVHTSKNTLGL